MTDLLDPKRLLLLLGLSFFFGLAFEGFHHGLARKPPGGVRSFPLLALLGAGLFVLDSSHAIAFAAGLLVLGGLLFAYYRRVAGSEGSDTDLPGAGLMAPACNMVAYLLGPIALTAPPWFSVGLTVAAVLLLSARERLHALAYRVPLAEIITLGKFLVLTGIILPLLPNAPVTSWTSITPYQVWLAVLAVSALSYGSYLIQRYLSAGSGILVSAVLGGLYSSTATTVVLARRIGTADGPASRQLQAGIVLATGLMYLRVNLVIAIFNAKLAGVLAPPMAVLLLAALVLTALVHGRPSKSAAAPGMAPTHPDNPLELSAAALFALAFVVISLAATWVRSAIGPSGLLWLAAVVGVSDINPFVLNLAQGGAGDVSVRLLAAAALIAASSNNLVNGAYSLIFSGGRRAMRPAAALCVLGLAGFALAAVGW